MAPSTAGVLGCFWTLLGLAGLLIIARLWLRLRIQSQSLVLSDGLLVIAWCGSLAHAIFVVIFAAKGALRPEIDYTLQNWDVDINKIEFVTKMIWTSVLPFFTSLYFCKFALLATYLQLFPAFMTKLRIALYITIAYCVSGYLVSMSVQLFLCWPIEGNWSFASDPAGLCDTKIIANIFYVAWSLHFSANLCILTLPFFVLNGLQMRRKTKIGIYATFALGFVDLAFSLTRFLTIHLGAGSFKPLTLIRFTLSETWSILDENMALIIACLPSLRPYLRIGFKSSSAEASYGYRYSGPGAPANHTSARRTHTGGDLDMAASSQDTGNGVRNSRRQSESEDDTWSDGKKSNRSDIELVTIQAGRENQTSPVGPGEIRVDQEFKITCRRP